jgi:hypothetical protein
MFCSVFCNAKNQEATKPSALMDVLLDEQTVGTLTATSSCSSFPHLEHLHQPTQPFDDDDNSISEEDLFKPVLEIEPSPSKESQGVVIVAEEPAQPAPVGAEPQEEETPPVSKEEFVAVLKKIEKENEWYEKRQAKKTGGKKKSRRNNKGKKVVNNSSSGGLQERTKRARTNGANAGIQPAAVRMPLASRN